MADDNEIKENGTNQEVGTASDYIQAIEKLKNETVAKEDYEKLREENKMLLNTIVNNEKREEVKVDEPVDIDKLRQDLFSGEIDMTNLDYITKALKLRKALMERGEKDPFLPSGTNIVPTEEDIQTAERVANIYQECIDIADGNPDIFNNELQRVTVDVVPNRKR